jgi:predicted RNase H-like HicB family nuclease
MSDPNDRDRQQRELTEELRHDADLRAESRRFKEETAPPMPTRYEQAAMRHARFEHLASGTYHGEIPGFPGTGVWGMGATPDDCQAALLLALQTTIAGTIRQHEGFRLPTFDGLRPDDE